MAEALERADAQRRNLMADVAHELRTPLHIIQGNLEGVLDGVYAPDEAHIDTTLEETRALARLVEDLRTLSLAEAGQLPLVWERVDVAELLADARTSFSGQAEAAGVALRVEAARGPSNGAQGESGGLTVRADGGRLDQVLANLLANALRHTQAGGAITLRAERASPEGVRIVVQDTGEGIPPEELPHIFDRFWRGEGARPGGTGAGARLGGRGTGSGLGLAIAKQLVQAHGGRIRAASEPGQGTTFTVELPLEPPSAG
jgi:two-component system sensor histidine kinase BaeS